MNLYEYEGKWVKLISTKGHIYRGFVCTYIDEEDNDPEPESVVLDNLTRDDGYKYSTLVEFTKPEIKSIEIIDRHDK